MINTHASHVAQANLPIEGDPLAQGRRRLVLSLTWKTLSPLDRLEASPMREYYMFNDRLYSVIDLSDSDLMLLCLGRLYLRIRRQISEYMQ